MSCRTIHTCDRCKTEFTEYGHTRSISLQTNDNFRDAPCRGFINVPVRVDWCFECCKAVGIIKAFSGEKMTGDVAPLPTMEELLREMIRGLVQEEVQYVEH